ncbi:MAG TPA: hypothetical protein VFX59_01925 [Polyangiales bacterium]|nr:hypothetical protein [Polyangiales bacterium]
MPTDRLALRELTDQLTKRERAVLDKLTTPTRIQAYLDETPYSTEPIYRAPLRVMRDRRAHCFDGAMFAAMALARLGHAPRLLDMLPWDDDDHVLALYKRGLRYGSIAKSNFTGLRGREPVYRSLRELLMSYFEPFFNLAHNRTLRGYTLPLSLRRFAGWTHLDGAMDRIAEGLDAQRKVTLFSAAEVRAFTKVDRLTVESNLWNADPKGLHRPKNR